MAQVTWAVTLGGQIFQLRFGPGEGDGYVLDLVEEEGAVSGSMAVGLRHVHHEKYLITLGNRTVPVFVHRNASGYKVVVQGHEFTAGVEEARLFRLRQEVASLQLSDGPAEIKAPMPGLVVRVERQEGETVEAGDGLIVIESMKMENEIKAPAAGVVQKVLVEPGQTVDKNQPLMRIAPPEEGA